MSEMSEGPRGGADRRRFLVGGALGTAAALGMPRAAAWALPQGGERPVQEEERKARERLRLAVKIGMVGEGADLHAKFALLKRLGYDGVEMDSPNGLHEDVVLRARDKTGLRVHGVVCSTHWQVRLSSPDAATRRKAVRNLETAVRDSSVYGGSSVLLVPGRVTKDESPEQVFERSVEGIRQVLPLAADLGIMILIENVWNGFCYEHGGPAKQSADAFVRYLDAIGSPWVGMYLDLGNHQKYADVPSWVRTLGRRVVKLDVKDWGVKGGWAKIGDGDVDWPGVREALAEIGFTGWCTAEVGGGKEERLRDIKARMERVLRGAS